MGSTLPVDILDQLTCDGRLPHLSAWLWLYESALHNDSQGPCLVQDHFLYNIAAPFADVPHSGGHPLAIRQQQESPNMLRTTMEVMLLVATANVLTLYPGGEKPGSYVSARQEHLLQQCHDAGLHLIGAQETRSKLDGYCETAKFHILSAPASSSGVGGVQLWVAKTFVFGDETYHVSQRFLRILHATTQRMVVALCAPWLKLLLIVGHAPSGSDTHMSQWWKTLPRVVPSAYRNWPSIYFLDANARVGSITTESVGDAGAMIENDSGECFHQWMIDHGLFAPQTFRDFHQGQHDTWEHGAGARARLDYVVLDKVLWHPQICTTVLTDLDISIKRTDHFAVKAEIPLCISRVVTGRRRPHKSQHLPDDRSINVPRVSWQVDVHTHAAILSNSLAPYCGTRKKARKAHLQPDTWELIQWKQYHWKRCNELRRTVKVSQLRMWFDSWRHCRTSMDFETVTPWFKSLHRQLAVHTYYVMKLSPMVATKVKQDDSQFYLDLSLQTAKTAADEGLPGLWRKLKPLLPKAISKRKSNLRCVGPTHIETRDHFNRLEAGHQVQYPEMLELCHQRQKEACHESPLVVKLADIPTMVDMEQTVMRQKHGKAPGLDQVTASVLRQAVSSDPRPFYDLILKSWITAAEPLQYKGGLIHCIAKKSGSREVAAMRGITLLDSFAKCFHALVRRTLLQWSQPRRLQTQFGGFAYQQTLFATQYIRSYARVAAHHQLSSAILFIDVKSAFHCMLREHVFGTGEEFPAALRKVLDDEGFDVELLTRRIQVHAQEFVQTSAPLTTRLLQDTHQSTWYALTGHDACYATQRGSRPGSPLADLAYNTLMTHVLQQIEDELQRNLGLTQSQLAMNMVCSPVAWVDDVAIPLSATTPEALEILLQETTQAVHVVMRRFGLTLNMAPGKTEAVVQYRGPRAPTYRKERFIGTLGHLPLGDPIGSLRIASSYQHLGTSFAQTATVTQEVQTRIGKATQVYRQLKRTVFANRRLAPHVRLVLLDSLVLSIVFHGAGNWPLLPYRLMKKLTHTVTSWQRSIIGLGHWSDENISDDALLARWALPSVAMRLAKFRVLYGIQWYRQAPSILTQLVTAEDFDDQSWLHAVRHDLAWLSTLDSKLVPAPPETAEAVFEWFHGHQHDGAKAVRRAIGRVVAENQAIFEVVELHKAIYTTCDQLGVQFVLPEVPRRCPDASYACDQCGRLFPTAQALQGHRWKRHHIFSDERKYIYSTTCAACHTCFWTVQRLQQHLKYTKAQPDGCYQWLVRHHAPLDEPCQPDTNRELLRFHRLPSCATYGPHMEQAIPYWQRQRDQKLSQLQQEWSNHGFPDVLPPHDQARAFHAYTTATMDQLQDVEGPTLDWLVVWSEASENLEPPLPVDLQTWTLIEWGRHHLYDICNQLDDPDVIVEMENAFLDLIAAHPMGRLLSEWTATHNRRAPVVPLQVEQPVRANSSRHDREQIPRYITMQEELLKAFCGRVVANVPRPKGIPVVVDDEGNETVYILHLFSGRRRHGDIGTYLTEEWQRYFGSTNLKVVLLSVDTAVHAQHGNLDRGPTYNIIVSVARLGAFALSLGGPPCETWSAARHLELPDSQGPRPLRSSEASWGLPNLRMKEIKQLQMGSRLMLHQLRIDTEVVLHGGASLKEHPGIPRNPKFASIWRTDIHRHLMMHLAEAHEINIQQWRFGAISPKPTIIRTIGIGHMGRAFRECEDPEATFPKEVLGGRDASGRFKTAAAKEYPPRLCKALTVAAIRGLHLRYVREGIHRVHMSSLSSGSQRWIREMAEASDHFCTDTFLPDYQPMAWWIYVQSACPHKSPTSMLRNGKKCLIRLHKDVNALRKFFAGCWIDVEKEK